MPSSFTVDQLDKIAFDAAYLYVGANPLGATTGGASFDPGITTRDITVDGMRAPFAGGRRRTKYKSIIKTKFLLVDSASWALLEQGASEGAGAGVTTQLVPPLASTLIPAGSMLVDLRMIGSIGDGTIVQVRFPLAYTDKYSVTSKDNSEWEVDAQWEAMLDLTAAGNTTDTAPYVVEWAAGI